MQAFDFFIGKRGLAAAGLGAYAQSVVLVQPLNPDLAIISNHEILTRPAQAGNRTAGHKAPRHIAQNHNRGIGRTTAKINRDPTPARWHHILRCRRQIDVKRHIQRIDRDFIDPVGLQIRQQRPAKQARACGFAVVQLHRNLRHPQFDHRKGVLDWRAGKEPAAGKDQSPL